MKASPIRTLLGGLILLAGVQATQAAADDSAKTTLERTDAFDRAYAASFYEFDACGDGVAGRIFRSALTDRLKQCPFSDAAKKRFQLFATAQRHKSSEMMNELIDKVGGIPVRLDGMSRTCHEQMDSPEYRQVRGRLDAFSAGKAGADSVVSQPCDAAEITP